MPALRSLASLFSLFAALTVFSPRPALAQEGGGAKRSLPAPAPSGWELTAEKTNFRDTGRYDEALSFCRRLEKASPLAKVLRYGTTPQGREMVALVLSKEKAFTPEAARRTGKPIVFVNNGIHSGEIEGKDAGLILARDILVTKIRASLLDGVTLVIIPVYSVDAHEERFGPYNRVNQNGPREMGWRSNSENLNLNRDWIKADAAETKALLRLLNAWNPDFLFDNHTTNGGDWRYTLLLDVPGGPTLDAGVAAWAKQMRAAVTATVEKEDGFLTAPYFSLRDPGRPEGGLSVQDFEPRYTHGYMTARNRPSMLVETHMLKPYGERVAATYSINARTIAYIGGNGKSLLAAIRAADSASATRPGGTFVLTSRTAPETRPFTFQGLLYAPFDSPITGGKVHAWTREPKDTPTTIRDSFVPGVTVTAPAAYAIPPQYTEIIARLDLHGLRYTRLIAPQTDTFDTWRLDSVTFPTTPFEGRFRPRYRAVPIQEKRTLPVGTAIVSTAQPGAKLLLHLLEPDAPDSLLSWGFFNGIFTTPEYAEEYAMEPIARKMLEDDPELKAAFEEKMKDPAFAGSRTARLSFFHERSPYFDIRKDKYPIVRLRQQRAGYRTQ